MRTGSLFYLLCLCLLINVVRSFWFFGSSEDTSMADQKKGVEVPRFATPEYEPPSQPKSWPALVGMDGEAAKETILQDMPDLSVVVLPEDSMVTRDFRLDRVRVFVNNDSKVSKPPRQG